MHRTLLLTTALSALLWTLTGAHGAEPASATTRPAMDRVVEKPSLSGPLEEVLERIEELAGTEISTDWTALQAAGVERDAQVVVKVSRATPGQLLDLALLQVAKPNRPLGWYERDGRLRVTTQMRAMYRRRVPVRTRRREPTTAPTTRPRGVELRFEEIPLDDVIEFFRSATRANFHVNWRSLEAVGISRETPVTLRLRNVTFGRALDVVCDQLSGPRGKFDRVYWVIDEGVVHLATGSVLNRRTQTRVYDVADLLMVVPDFEGPELELGERESDDGGGEGSGLFVDDEEDDDGGPGEQRERLRETLVSIITESIGDDMWRPIGKGTVHIRNNQLIVTQTPLGFKLLEDALDSR